MAGPSRAHALSPRKGGVSACPAWNKTTQVMQGSFTHDSIYCVWRTLAPEGTLDSTIQRSASPWACSRFRAKEQKLAVQNKEEGCGIVGFRANEQKLALQVRVFDGHRFKPWDGKDGCLAGPAASSPSERVLPYEFFRPGLAGLHEVPERERQQRYSAPALVRRSRCLRTLRLQPREQPPRQTTTTTTAESIPWALRCSG